MVLAAQESLHPLTKVLLVDDRVENLLALESLLADLPSQKVQICKAQSGREALELLLKDDFALALLDVQMPEINGFELAELMRGSEKTMAIPIIFVTAGAIDTKHTFMGYEAGAVGSKNCSKQSSSFSRVRRETTCDQSADGRTHKGSSLSRRISFDGFSRIKNSSHVSSSSTSNDS
jgi:CheY-like chemotaxis protein